MEKKICKHQRDLGLKALSNRYRTDFFGKTMGILIFELTLTETRNESKPNIVERVHIVHKILSSMLHTG